MPMVSVDEAQSLIAGAAPRPRRESIPLARAAGRVLYSDVHASLDQPPFDASAMDGYAVTALPEAGQALRIIGESQAGRPFTGCIEHGEAVRIFTGAPLPDGANRIIIQENISAAEGTVRLRPDAISSAKPHVRARGSDFARGDILLQAGDRLTAERLAVVAAAGQARVTVARRPRIVLVITGDEIVSPGQALTPGQVYDATSIALAAMISDWGGRLQGTLHAHDDADDLTRQLTALNADLIVTLGGASVGDYDLVRTALQNLDAVWLFDKVRVRPGKPTAFACIAHGRHCLCLPGNPAAALICARLFLKTYIEAATGLKSAPPFTHLPCAVALPADGERETFLRAIALTDETGMTMLLPIGDDDSSSVRAFGLTSALIRRRASAPALAAGEPCECLLMAT